MVGVDTNCIYLFFYESTLRQSTTKHTYLFLVYIILFFFLKSYLFNTTEI